METTAKISTWWVDAQESMRRNHWSEALRHLRAGEQEEAEEPRWQEATARLYLLTGQYVQGLKVLPAPFVSRTCALARLREAFYAAQNWQTSRLHEPTSNLQEQCRLYAESALPEGPFLALAHWGAWLMRCPECISDAYPLLEPLLEPDDLADKRLLSPTLEALLVETWYRHHGNEDTAYPRRMVLETVCEQAEFSAVCAYLRFHQSRQANEADATRHLSALYCKTGIWLWLRCLPLLAVSGDTSQRERIKYQLEKADTWLEPQIGVELAETTYPLFMYQGGVPQYQNAAIPLLIP